MSIIAPYKSVLQPIETAPAAAGLASGTKLVFSDYDTEIQLGAGSVPVVTKKANFLLTLSGGAATIDLTALPDLAGVQDFTGLKVQAIKFRNPSANVMTISKGASNGYGLDGGNAFTIPVAPVYQSRPGEFLGLFPEGTPDVAAGAKNIAVAGTGTQTLQCTILAG